MIDEMIDGILLIATGLELQCHIYFCVFLHALRGVWWRQESSQCTAHLISVSIIEKLRESLDLLDISRLISFDCQCHCHFLQSCNTTTSLMQRNFLTSQEARYRVPHMLTNESVPFPCVHDYGKESFRIILYGWMDRISICMQGLLTTVSFNKWNISILIVSFFLSDKKLDKDNGT